MSGKLRLNGATSGYSELQAPDVAGDQTFTLPAVGGTLSTVGYQQGVWTPTYDSTSRNVVVTYNTQAGDYVRIGQQITLTYYVTLSAATSGSGSLILGQFPYVASVSNGRGTGTCYGTNFDSNNNPTFLLSSADTSEARIYTYDANNASSSVGAASTKDGSSLIGTITYITDDTTWIPINGATLS